MLNYIKSTKKGKSNYNFIEKGRERERDVHTIWIFVMSSVVATHANVNKFKTRLG